MGKKTFTVEKLMNKFKKIRSSEDAEAVFANIKSSIKLCGNFEFSFNDYEYGCTDKFESKRMQIDITNMISNRYAHSISFNIWADSFIDLVDMEVIVQFVRFEDNHGGSSQTWTVIEEESVELSTEDSIANILISAVEIARSQYIDKLAELGINRSEACAFVSKYY